MYRIPYENEQITKTIAAPYAPADFTDAEKQQFRDNIGAEQAGRYSNPNLLDNPFFTVNQRGQTTYTNSTENNIYSVDRWSIAYCSLSVNSDGSISVKADGHQFAGIYQLLPIEDGHSGEIVTVSVKIDGSVVSATLTVPSTNGKNVEMPFEGFPTCRVRCYRNLGGNKIQLSIELTDTVTHIIKAVKLELGSVSTLANDSAPDYATELFKCHRYFRSLTYGKTGLVYLFNAMCSYGTVAHAILPIEMRAKPTVTVIGNIADFNVYTSSGHAATAVSVGGINIGFGIDLTFNVSGGLTAGQAALIFLDSGKTSDIWLSADL